MVGVHDALFSFFLLFDLLFVTFILTHDISLIFLLKFDQTCTVSRCVLVDRRDHRYLGLGFIAHQVIKRIVIIADLGLQVLSSYLLIRVIMTVRYELPILFRLVLVNVVSSIFLFFLTCFLPSLSLSSISFSWLLSNGFKMLLSSWSFLFILVNLL